MPESYIERMEEYKERIDEEYHEVFETLVGAGSNPKTVGAAIQYVTTADTQAECADDWECTAVAVRQNYPGVLALLDQDSVVGGRTRSGSETAEDVVAEIVELLDWEEGREYSVSESSGSVLVSVNKAGLVSVRDALTGDGE